MSRTARAVDHGWGPGNPEFDDWNASRHRHTGAPLVMSVKHQTRDRAPRGKEGGRHGRFMNHGKNSLYNLRRKNDPAVREGLP